MALALRQGSCGGGRTGVRAGGRVRAADTALRRAPRAGEITLAGPAGRAGHIDSVATN